MKGSDLDIVTINKVIYGHGDPNAPNCLWDKFNKLWDKFNKLWETVKPRLGKRRGKIIIMGTGGENGNFKNLWELKLKKEKDETN